MAVVVDLLQSLVDATPYNRGQTYLCQLYNQLHDLLASITPPSNIEQKHGWTWNGGRMHYRWASSTMHEARSRVYWGLLGVTEVAPELEALPK
jgi:hypothetical protein